MTKEEMDLMLYLTNLVKNGMTSIIEMITEITKATGDEELMVNILAKIGAMRMAIEQEKGTLGDLLS